LQENDGDLKLAIEYLRKRGENINAKGLQAPAGGSRISACLSDNRRRVFISKTTSLTDFAAESEIFVKFSESVNKSLISANIMDSSLPMDFKLTGSISPQIHSTKFQDVVSDMSSILAEPISVADIQKIEGDFVSLYVHGKSSYSSTVGSMASAVSFRVAELSDEQRSLFGHFADKIARQVLATKPTYISSKHVPSDVLDKEKEGLAARVKNPNAFEKALSGHLKKFYSENCLMDMEWIIPSQSGESPEGLSVRDVLTDELRKMGLNSDCASVVKFVIMK